MKDIRRTSLLVQIVDVLGDNVHVVFFLQTHQLAVAFVGFYLKELTTAFVVEIKH